MTGRGIQLEYVAAKLFYGYHRGKGVNGRSPFKLMYGKAARIIGGDEAANMVDQESREV